MGHRCRAYLRQGVADNVGVNVASNVAKLRPHIHGNERTVDHLMPSLAE